MCLTFLVAEKHCNTAQAVKEGNYHLGIFELTRPVGTVCQWRGRPLLKHSGPHQPTILKHPFRNNSSHPCSLMPVPLQPPFLSLICSQKSTKEQKIKTNVDLIHIDFLVAWNYFCSYASISHIYTYKRTHTQRNDTKKQKYTHAPHCFLFWTYHTLQLVGKLKAFLIQKLYVFWYSVNM